MAEVRPFLFRVLYSFLYDLLRLVMEILILRGRGDAQLRAEVSLSGQAI